MAKLALRSNRKFRRLLAMVRVDSPEHLRGHLSALWETTWENGTPLVGDLQDIEAAAGWTMPDTAKYPPGALAEALVTVRLVDVVVPGKLYAVHDWYDHAPAYVKQRIGREIKEDPTVCTETFFLGLEAWQRRAAEIGIDVVENALEDDSDPDLPTCGNRSTDPVENANGDRNARHLDIRSPEQGSRSRFGYLSSLAESRQVKPSPETSSPPRSPSPSIPAGELPADPKIRVAARQVVDAIAHLFATGVRADAESADEIAAQAETCRNPADWTALAGLANEALRDSARFLIASSGARA